MESVNKGAAAGPEAATETKQLGATDLRNVLLLLEVSTNRGAWKASELSQVGAIHDRIVAALEAAGAGEK